MREIAARLVFPLVMGAGLFAGYWIIENNIFENPLVAAVPIGIAAIIVMGILERILPYRKKWGESHNDVLNDILHMFINQFVILNVSKVFWNFALLSVVAYLAARFGGQWWPTSWNIFAQMFLVLLIAEFGRYWVHRWAHNVPWMWRLHAVHHSPKRLYILNATKFHPLEKALFFIPETVPFVILGTTPEALLMYSIFNSIHGLFQHGNVYVRLGWLNYIFSMTELHRWHHSRKISESNTNYGNNLIIWDIVFGTFFYPKKREVSEIGLINPDYPETYIGQIKAPFMGDVDKPADFLTNPEKYAEYDH